MLPSLLIKLILKNVAHIYIYIHFFFPEMNVGFEQTLEPSRPFKLCVA